MSVRTISTGVNIDYHQCMATLDIGTIENPAAGHDAGQACCAPVSESVITPAEAGELALALKALADPARLRLLSIVAASPGQEACVCDLIEPVGLSQPTVSHHLKILSTAGYLTRSKRGTWAYYRLVPGALAAVASAFAPRG